MSVQQTISFRSSPGQTLTMVALRASDRTQVAGPNAVTNILDDSDNPTVEYTSVFSSLPAAEYIFQSFNTISELVGEYPRKLTYETRVFAETECCDNALVPADVVTTTSDLIYPESTQRLGCTVPTKGNVYFADERVCATLDWTLRNKNGNVIDLSEYEIDADITGSLSVSLEGNLPRPEVDIFARFQIPEVPLTLLEVRGVSPYPPGGKVHIPLPDCVSAQPGIWQVQVGLVDTVKNRPLLVDSGIVSVERTLWGDPNTAPWRGPITLNEIRTYLRDTPQENELLQEYEFSTDEILYSMLRPIRQWNEMPPRVSTYSSMNFPFPEHWTKATVGFLLHTAGLWFLRNKANVTGGGLQFADRDKDQPYLALAAQYQQEWMEFLRHQKFAQNVNRTFAKIVGPRPSFPWGW